MNKFPEKYHGNYLKAIAKHHVKKITLYKMMKMILKKWNKVRIISIYFSFTEPGFGLLRPEQGFLLFSGI